MNKNYTPGFSFAKLNHPSHFLIAIIFFLVLSFSCKKEQTTLPGLISNNSSNLFSIVHYCGGTNTNLDGEFLFQSNVTNNDSVSALKGIAEITGFFTSKNGGVFKGGPISFNGQDLLPDSGGYYNAMMKGIYGTELNFSLTTPTPTANVPGSMYVPLPIYIANVPAISPITINNGSSFEVKWNADPKNKKGVMLLAQYDSSVILRDSANISSGYYTNFSNSVFVPDAGDFVLPWSFFSKFPSGVQVILWAVRGNFAIVNNGGSRYQVGGYSSTAIWNVNVLHN